MGNVDDVDKNPNFDGFHAPFFLFGYNEEGKFNYLSPSVKDVLGEEADKWVGKHLTDFFDLKCKPEDVHRELFYRADAEDYAVQLKSELTGGKQCVLRIQPYDLPDRKAKSHAFFAIAQDITDWWQHRQQLQERYEELISQFEQLSQRELQVLSYLPQGRTIANIARALNLSTRGIEHIRSRLIKKLKVSTTAQLIGLCKERELLKEYFEERID